MTGLRGKTIVMSGGSRGIGLAIALRAARDGANVALLAKTSTPHPRLEGTIHTAAEEIEAAGGQALAIAGDVRDDDVVAGAVEQAAERFGGIDIVVNNASAIDTSPSATIAMKRYDLMQDVNVRGTFLLSRTCLPYLREAANPHVLTLSPPLSLDPKWYGPHLAYTLAKFGMSMCTLGMASEHADAGIAFNSLWPRTIIATAAVQTCSGARPRWSARAGPRSSPTRRTTSSPGPRARRRATSSSTTRCSPRRASPTSARTPTWGAPTSRSTSSSTADQPEQAAAA
jgi:citronellol/citronellal dehydrogenase